MRLIFNEQACTGCHLCELACTGAHEKAFSKEKSRLQITAGYSRHGALEVAGRLCSQCDSCMDACPDGAINRENKYLKVDGNRCTMCGICADVCPKGVIRIPREGGALICDLCDGDPQCVIWCARGALTLLGAKLEREVEQVV